ncbi:MAG: hypothetical protein IKU54_05205 [Oscillospiraceae bacterium]|nr:hypothetical protein [Oscillospiraceae bacterium]
MTMFHVYVIAGPINALIWCACITFLLKNFHLKSHIRAMITYLVYLIITFSVCGSGGGIFNMDFATFDTTKFVVFAASGFCVCLFLFLFYERGNIGRKIEAKRNAKNSK